MTAPRIAFALIVVLVFGGARLALAPPPPAGGSAAAPPVAIFAVLDGTWEGTFVGWDERGREQYRIAVRQTYRTKDATTQTVTIADRMPDGTVVHGEGENTARRRPDGTLELRCVVRKSNGETVRHEGRLVKGPGGDEEIVWHSGVSGRVETFREHVRPDGEHVVYEINGMGRYGTTSMLMAGRYRRVP